MQIDFNDALALTPHVTVTGVGEDQSDIAYGLEAALPVNQSFLLSATFDLIEGDDYDGNYIEFKGVFKF